MDITSMSERQIVLSPPPKYFDGSVTVSTEMQS
jgi:hypothetical protein